MKVRIDKTYAMPAPADVTWALLHDIEAVAGCMPGAAITERVAEGQRLQVIRADIDAAVLADGLVTLVLSLTMAAVQLGGSALDRRATGVDALFQSVLTIGHPQDAGGRGPTPTPGGAG